MQSSRLLLALGLSFTGITAAIVYLLFRKDEETELDGGVLTSRQTIIKKKIPKALVGTLIGRQGANIKAIQEKSGARISCGDEASDEQFRIFEIRGSPESAQLAESIIQEMICNQPLTITHEMWVPQRCCGRIIGKGGETVRLIQRTSSAKVTIDNSGGDERSADRRILLQGTAEQVALAQSLIEEKVEEDTDFRRKMDISVANRSPRREPKDNLRHLMAPSIDLSEESSSLKTEKFSSSEGFFDVFVSALESPEQFWVQLVTQRGVELDQLNDKMNDYYSNQENKKNHILQEISVGQIVATVFEMDNKWYRAEVLEIEEDDYDPAQSNVTVYYPDYGDSAVVKRNQLYDLRTDFLTLYFQAIECSLSGVKPLGDQWSDEATNCFEELAEVATWRKKMAHVITYRDGVRKKGRRAGSPVPVVELHDMEKNINIGEELVKKGYAVRDSSSSTNSAGASNGSACNESPATIPTKASSPQKPVMHSSLGLSTETSSVLKFDQQPLPSSGLKTTLPDQTNSNCSTSSSFINQEKNSGERSKFRPKTLETSKKKKPLVSNSEPGSVYVLPESYSDDDDEDGFSLG